MSRPARFMAVGGAVYMGGTRIEADTAAGLMEIWTDEVRAAVSARDPIAAAKILELSRELIAARIAAGQQARGVRL